MDIVDVGHLRRCLASARRAGDTGNEPFGSLLVTSDGVVGAERTNTIGTGDVSGHPELAPAAWASHELSPGERAAARLHTSCESCAMCAGARFWAGIDWSSFALCGDQLAALAAGEARALRRSSREVFARGNVAITVEGRLRGAGGRRRHRVRRVLAGGLSPRRPEPTFSRPARRAPQTGAADRRVPWVQPGVSARVDDGGACAMTRSIVSGAGVVGRIRDQHAEIRLGFEEVAAAAPSARGAAFAPLRRLLALHETAEEIVVYPSVVAADRQAVAAVHARKAEERRAKVALADLESMDPSSAAFADRFDEFRADVEAHAAAEEVEVLPVLEARHRAGMLEHLDRVFVAVQAIGPTHAHRFAPVGAVGNLAIGPVVGALDRTRDFLEQHRR